MTSFIEKPTKIQSAGNLPKVIEEFIGNVNSKEKGISIAKMNSPENWTEPGQCPQFDEYTIVLKGSLKVETKEETYVVNAGQAIHIEKGNWVRYSSPENGGAEYIAVCLPAFSPNTVNRDSE